MNLKELIKEVERLKYEVFEIGNPEDDKKAYLNAGKRQGIKQTVEAVDELRIPNIDNLTQYLEDNIFESDSKDWRKLKKLLGVK